MTDKFPRETVEHLPIGVTVKNALGAVVPITVDIETSLAPIGWRPSTWLPAVTVDGLVGVMIQGLTRGSWTIFARVAESPEVPVMECGTVIIT